jgi:hypothetical protein
MYNFEALHFNRLITLVTSYRNKEKPFLFEIVANKRNGIDVDKYVLVISGFRDSGKGVLIFLS